MYVYVMRRRDGWHKIGHCQSSAEHRAVLVSRGQPHAQRPVTVVRSFSVEHPTMVEAIAHAEMDRLGHVRNKGKPSEHEWFNASSSACTRAVKRAIRLYEYFGSHGWLLVRKRDYWAMVKSREKPQTLEWRPDWTPEQVVAAKAVWFSRDYATNVIAAKYLPKGMAAKHAWLLFGASGRPYKKSKKR